MKLYFALVFLLFIGEGHTEIYKWVDENGVTHFSQNMADVPKETEIKEVKVRKTNSGQITRKKETSNSIENQNTMKKYSPEQLDKKCNELANIAAMDTNGLNSPEYREFRKIGCGSASRMMRK